MIVTVIVTLGMLPMYSTSVPNIFECRYLTRQYEFTSNNLNFLSRIWNCTWFMRFFAKFNWEIQYHMFYLLSETFSLTSRSLGLWALDSLLNVNLKRRMVKTMKKHKRKISGKNESESYDWITFPIRQQPLFCRQIWHPGPFNDFSIFRLSKLLKFPYFQKMHG